MIFLISSNFTIHNKNSSVICQMNRTFKCLQILSLINNQLKPITNPNVRREEIVHRNNQREMNRMVGEVNMMKP